MLFSRSKFAALGNICPVLQYSYSLFETGNEQHSSPFGCVLLWLTSFHGEQYLTSNAQRHLTSSLYFFGLKFILSQYSGSRVNCLPWDDCEGTPGPFFLPNALHKVKETGLVHLYDSLDKNRTLGKENRSVARI